MKLLKIALLVVVAFAGYKAHRHLILGIPINPDKTLAEWSQQVNAKTPTQITDSITLVGVRFDWQEPAGVANLYDKELKNWAETYEVTGPRDQNTLEQAKDAVIASICRDKMHQQILAITSVELILRTPKEIIAVDPATAFRLGTGAKALYPIEKRISVGKANCVGT